MATHTDQYDNISLQIALARQSSADIYSDDARRAWQTRRDELSMGEAVANQTQATSRLAQDAIAANLTVRTPTG